MRLAWFTPLPPTRSGIADYSMEVLPSLADRFGIDVFVASTAERQEAAPRLPGLRVQDAHDFVWRHHTAPYDLTVFQMGNAWCHDYMWPYLFRYPGLVVLHDAHLHHARAWSLLRRRRSAEYRAELAFNHPELAPSAAEAALSGFAGPLYYFWPMLRSVVTSARAVAVHNPRLGEHLSTTFPDAAITAVRMGVPAPVGSDGVVRELRRRHGLEPGTVVLAAFGAVTPEKRIDTLLRAFARTRAAGANAHLLLVGQMMPHYDVAAAVRAAGVADAVSVTGFVDDESLAGYVRLTDVAVCLRWPTGGETSASWLRAIAGGRATIVMDLAQHVDVSTLDPRSWAVVHARPTLAPPDPIAVSIDLMDEDHSLGLALRRLVSDAPLRAALGNAAASHWATHHTVEHMVGDYIGLLVDAGRRAAPARDLPAHLRPDGLQHARALLAPFGVDGDRLF